MSGKAHASLQLPRILFYFILFYFYFIRILFSNPAKKF